MNVELFPGGLTGARLRARAQSDLTGALTESTKALANPRVLLRAAGAVDAVVDELLRHDEPLVEADGACGSRPDPAEESRWQAWTTLAERSALVGLVPALCRRCPQLLFPIRAGIGSTDAYRLVTRRGIWPVGMPGATGLELRRPTEIALTLHSSLMGRIPLMVVPDRRDFENLVRAFTARNEPVPVPPSIGACLVAGFNQWEDRVILLGVGG